MYVCVYIYIYVYVYMYVYIYKLSQYGSYSVCLEKYFSVFVSFLASE